MSDFDPRPFIDTLEQGASLLPVLLQSVPVADRARRPRPDAWSPLEIAAHLLDEEREDFRQRLRLTLEDPQTPWPPIDPEGWVSERAYSERHFEMVLEQWGQERRTSLRWLKQLESPDWSRAHEHPALGALRAGDLLCAWAAHDHLHARQILRTRWALLEPSCRDYSARYAMP